MEFQEQETYCVELKKKVELLDIYTNIAPKVIVRHSEQLWKTASRYDAYQSLTTLHLMQ